MTICVIYPVGESTAALKSVSNGLWGDLTALYGKKNPKHGEQNEVISCRSFVSSTRGGLGVLKNSH